jgi:hypothetical protein
VPNYRNCKVEEHYLCGRADNVEAEKGTLGGGKSDTVNKHGRLASGKTTELLAADDLAASLVRADMTVPQAPRQQSGLFGL